MADKGFKWQELFTPLLDVPTFRAAYNELRKTGHYICVEVDKNANWLRRDEMREAAVYEVQPGRNVFVGMLTNEGRFLKAER